VTILFSFRSIHPFGRFPSFLPLTEMDPKQWPKYLNDPDFKARLLSESDPNEDVFSIVLNDCWDNTYVLGNPPNYEPDPNDSIAKMAERAGRDPKELAYEIMLEDDCSRFLLFAVLGYSDGSLDPVHTMLSHPSSTLGASDGGAHCRAICDAGVPTFMLTHWGRDRARGDRLPLEWVVRKQTSETAKLFGLHDRGRIAPGFKADLNLIDFDNLQVGPPQLVHDLPANAPRLVQKAEGYVSTMVSGIEVSRNGEDTGTRPGRLIRGPQRPPSS
jgi:N-acyl-D-aspartate/D-glutamate deacylase